MTSIPGMVYVVVGALVAGVSLFVNIKTGSAQMTLLLMAGVIFIFIGGVRLVLRPPAKVAAPAPPKTHPAHPMHPQHRLYKQMASHSPPAHGAAQGPIGAATLASAARQLVTSATSSASRPLSGQSVPPAPRQLPSGVHIYHCENCQAKVYSTAQYCHMCGTKLR